MGEPSKWTGEEASDGIILILVGISFAAPLGFKGQALTAVGMSALVLIGLALRKKPDR